MKSKQLMEFFKLRKTLILVVFLVLLGGFLRAYNFHNLVRFNDDQVRDSQVVDKMVNGEGFPLLGPKAGGTKFNLGPAFYYLEYFSALIFGNSPAGIAFFVLLLSIFSIPLFFYFLRFYFSENVSLAITFFYATSFYMIKYSKFVWNPNVIPFFFLLFLIALYKILTNEKGKKIFIWYLLLGISAGIGVQLHTFLLVLIPVSIMTVFIYLLVKRKKNIAGFLVVIFLGLFLNLPFFIHDLKNNGENIKLFFQATEKKTNASLAGNFFKNGQFFIQSNVYVLSGFEPQKNWLEVKKFLVSKNAKEIVVALGGSLFSIFSLILLGHYLKKEKEKNKKIFLFFLSIILIFSFLIFWPLAHELKSRFFIVNFIFPFIFLALVLDFLAKKIRNKKIIFILGILLVLLFSFFNSLPYRKAYFNFADPVGKSDIYGGLSLKEAEEISKFIVDSSKKEGLAGKKFYLLSFKFNRSIGFLNKKAGLKTSILSNSSAEKIGSESVLVYLGKSKNKESIIKKNSSKRIFIDSWTVGRFEVFLFQNK